MAVCAVNAVPTKRASTISLSDVEKTPESAITAAPQSSKKGTRTEVGEQKNTGDATQHAPLITSAHTAAGERPKRSDAHPPRRHPNVPATPMATNAIGPVDDAASPRAARPLAMNVASQVHRA